MDVVYPLFAPTVVVFLLGSSAYGVWKASCIGCRPPAGLHFRDRGPLLACISGIGTCGASPWDSRQSQGMFQG